MKLNQKITKNPLVSIVMPVYNAEKFIGEAIESILAQTYKNFELVIVDDVSQDSSFQIAKFYESKFPQKIKAIKLKKNTNAAGNGAMNAVFTKLKGEFIARMDADDIAHRRRIEKQVNFLVNNEKALLVGTQANIIDGNGKKTGEKKFPTKWKEIYEEYFVFHPILHPSVMFRKSLLPSKKYIYENCWGINDDYYTFFKLLNYGEFHNLKEKLLSYRMHGENSSLQNPKKKFINSVKIRLLALNLFGYKPTFKGIFLFLAQILTISLIPESFIVPLYFAIRGVKKIEYKKGKRISSNTNRNLNINSVNSASFSTGNTFSAQYIKKFN